MYKFEKSRATKIFDCIKRQCVSKQGMYKFEKSRATKIFDCIKRQCVSKLLIAC